MKRVRYLVVSIVGILSDTLLIINNMIVAFDTYYYNGFSYTVGGVFRSWGDKEVSYFVTSIRTCIDAEYKPGELYKRELPCIMQCLSLLNIDTIETIIVDGFVWLSEDGKTLTKGLGAHLQDAIFAKYNTKKTIVGIAKNRYHVDIPECVDIERGLVSSKPLFITCSETCFTKHYAAHIKIMHGDYRMPSIIKAIDSKTREIGDEHEKEIEKEINESEKELEEEYNSRPLDFNLTDLDNWADENLRFNDEAFENWVAETEKNGFRFR
jgi:deoxyribonuclease V